ncbi:phage baseplate assembly protein V [Amycolatopsis sp. PS_44_ISF1]|uniref:phage baseplate assembly protein V n=1 Tax=Amycolatopsis sp. PS_44_ISF1 TaxID=2974917 RepID=UPI0028DE3D6E|nr:phage baseplate assembly protein V [Amycolatopsis sp. PS_44_ISF1]MDT8913125.1 phage baseplate assembly protein V [Amycolatopsis sp. PS_44_ISF1]
MTDPGEGIANTEPTGKPAVVVDGVPLPDGLASRLLRVVVDNDLHLPGMFELTFLDMTGQTTAEAGITIGSAITIAGAGEDGVARTLIVGEATAIEGQIDGITIRTVVRGYTGAHRLQRARRSRSFVNVTDADVARQVAGEAGLELGLVEATSTTHPYLAQVNQTDWEFLDGRAREIGFEMGVADGLFFFRPATLSLLAAGGHPSGLLRSAAAGLLDQARTIPVTFPDELFGFRPRVSGANVTPDVEVRVWDPMTRTALAQNADTPIDSGPSALSMGGQFTAGGPLARLRGAADALEGTFASFSPTGVSAGAEAAEDAVTDTLSQATGGLVGSPVGFLGPPPSPTAHVVADRPLADTTTMATTGPMAAAAVATDFGSTYAECEGEVKGNAAIQPNSTIDVQGVQAIFSGTWQVSRARHVFDDSEFGYRVIFSAHGRQDRTVLGLTSKAGRGSARNPVLEGVVCGVVSDCADPLGKGRMKVTLPWLSPAFETDWAPNVQFCSGPRSGAIFMPEIGDEVLVAFEFGDVRRAYVLGAMMNDFTAWSIAQSGPIFAGGLGGLATGAIGLTAETVGSAVGSALLPMAGPLGGMLGGQAGRQAGHELGNEAVESVSGATLVPGLVSEVHHRGFVSSTGNALLFYDVPMIPPLPSAADAGAVAGQPVDAGGGTASAGVQAVPPGVGAIASAVRVGSQGGEIGLTVDQVSGGVDLTASAVPGVTTIPVPNINIVAENGFVNIGAGAGGTMLIDGGVNLIIKATGAITLDAPLINLLGVPTVNGVPIPL